MLPGIIAFRHLFFRCLWDIFFEKPNAMYTENVYIPIPSLPILPILGREAGLRVKDLGFISRLTVKTMDLPYEPRENV